MSNTEVKIIPIFSTILHPTDLVVTEKQTKDTLTYSVYMQIYTKNNCLCKKCVFP